MSSAQQLAAIARDPSAVGALSGIPAWARDRANRMVLARAMSIGDDAHAGTGRAVAQEISERETAGEQVQLLELDVEEGLVALALGDLDTADSIGLLVPGTGTDVASDLDAVADDAAAVGDAARAAAPGLAVATVAWLGYRTPPDLGRAGNPFAGYARDGGRALNATLNGLASGRAVTPGGRPHVTVVGHSYGTVVIDRAADAPGRVAADDVVLLGSPGMENEAAELEVETVYEASAFGDPVSSLFGGWHGQRTDSFGYGAEELPTDWDMGHSDYYDCEYPTVNAIGEVLAGVREPA